LHAASTYGARDGFYVRGVDVDPVLVTEKVLEEDLQAVRQSLDVEASRERVETVELECSVSDRDVRFRVEAVRAVSRGR
jgi:hypothetical protein